jgi:hypothetical protein
MARKREHQLGAKYVMPQKCFIASIPESEKSTIDNVI